MQANHQETSRRNYGDGVEGFVEVDKTQFETIEKTPGINFVVFWRDNCGSCHHLYPILEKLAKEFGHGVKFFRIELTEEDTEFKERHDITGFPSANVYYNGTFYQQIVGYRHEPFYITEFSRILQDIADKNNIPRVFRLATGGLVGNAV